MESACNGTQVEHEGDNFLPHFERSHGQNSMTALCCLMEVEHERYPFFSTISVKLKKNWQVTQIAIVSNLYHPQYNRGSNNILSITKK